MCVAIENPAKCEMRVVKRFFTAKQYSATAIHREICAVYRPSVMSEEVVHEEVCLFKSGQTNIHDEERSSRPSLVTNELVRKVDEKVRKNRCFTISKFSDEFPQTSRTVLHEIVTERLAYRKSSTRWVLNAGSRHRREIFMLVEFLS